MKRLSLLIVAKLLFMSNPIVAQSSLNHNSYLRNRYPLHPKAYLSLPFGAIRPKDWLLQELVSMKNGMCGHLDELYPSVLGKRNGWLGGDGDVWERGPYWLDGLAPLAFILDDAELKAKLQPWIEWSIAKQQPAGYFGPVPPEKEPAPEPGLQRDRARDWWPKMVMLKVFQQYYLGTGDQRVIRLMLRYARYQLKTLPVTPLGHYSWWGAQRGGDNLLIVYWLYNLTGEKFLLDLAELIHHQVFDWTGTFLDSDELSQTYRFHGVNLAQGIKEPVIYFQQHPEDRYIHAVKNALRDIRMYQGQAQGMYGADEMTRGNDPVQGSERCSAVEMMYSLENMISITGDVGMMDQLEKIAYNALPAQISPDYTSRQYYQEANQVMITRHQRNFVTSYDGTDLCFGVLTGFPCCTTNMHQGWPKFIQNMWFATEDKGLAALLYGPSEVTARVADGDEVTITEETQYPFAGKMSFTMKTGKEVEFPLHLRIPAWCDSATIRVNGQVEKVAKGNQVIRISRRWRDHDKVELFLPIQNRLSRWFNNSVAVERGPLVYGLRIGEQWKEIKNDDHYGNFMEVHPTTTWNYGLSEDAVLNPESIEVKTKEFSGNPWTLENAPVELKVKGKLIPEWTLYNETAGPLPYSPIEYLKKETPVTLTLVPYGCTKLRISEFPVVK